MVERQVLLRDVQAVVVGREREDALENLHNMRSNLWDYLDLLLRHPAGLTDQEAAILLRWKVTSVCARRGDLKRKFPHAMGFVYCGDERRMGDSGVANKVWFADTILYERYCRSGERTGYVMPRRDSIFSDDVVGVSARG